MTKALAPPSSKPIPALHHARLWAFAAKMLAHLVDWFRGPEAVAREGAVNRRWVWDFVPRLQPIVLLVKRLVLEEARALAEGPALRTGARTASHAFTAARAPGCVAPVWRGRFVGAVWPGAPRLPPPPPLRRHERVVSEPRLSEPKYIDVAPFARRLDAVQRVLANPHVAARRLALRLRKSNAPPRALKRPRLVPRVRSPEDWRPRLREAHARAERRDSG